MHILFHLINSAPNFFSQQNNVCIVSFDDAHENFEKVS